MKASAIIGAALVKVQKDPANATAILTGEAYRILGAADHPKNKHAKPQLVALAGELTRLAYASASAYEHVDDPEQQWGMSGGGTDGATVDEFDAMTEDAAKAADIAAAANGGAEASDLDQEAARREIAARRDGDEFRVIVPRSILGSPIGRSATITYQPTAAQQAQQIVQQQTVVFWQGKRHESQSFTIDIDIDPSSVMPGTSSRPYAIIQVGTDGFNGIPTRVDVGLGLRLCGAGSYVSVSVAQDAPASWATNGSALLNVGGRMGFFAAPSVQPVLSTTAYIDNLPRSNFATPLANIVNVPRPPRATFLAPVQMSDPNGNVTLNFLDSTNTLIYTLTLGNGQMIANAPISNDCYSINVVNNSTSLANTIRLPFLLSL